MQQKAAQMRKLTDQQEQEIAVAIDRKDGTYRSLAAKYKVSQTTIHKAYWRAKGNA